MVKIKSTYCKWCVEHFSCTCRDCQLTTTKSYKCDDRAKIECEDCFTYTFCHNNSCGNTLCLEYLFFHCANCGKYEYEDCFGTIFCDKTGTLKM